MKIQEFCSKIREDKEGVFRTLRALRKIDVQTLLDDGGDGTWDPWTCVSTPGPVTA
jgi:hypothetical protein